MLLFPGGPLSDTEKAFLRVVNNFLKVCELANGDLMSSVNVSRQIIFSLEIEIELNDLSI